MNNKIKTVLWVAAFAAFVALAVFAYNALKDETEPQPGTDAVQNETLSTKSETKKLKAPDFTVSDINGTPVKLSDMAGKPVVLNFWASWCPPCKAEMPEFDKVYKEVGEDVLFMMVNTLDRDTVASGKEFIEAAGYSFPIYFDTNQNEASANYNIRSYPTTIFIDKDGYVVTAAQGQINEQALRKGIELMTSL